MSCDLREHGSGNALEIVASLRAAMGSGSQQTLQAITGRLDAVEAALSRVLTEHSGMADELLRVYEQLGIVFEVTRQLPTVRSEDEVLQLFVRSLQTTYPHSFVGVVGENAGGERLTCRPENELPPWVRTALATCRYERRIVVADCPEPKVDVAGPRCTGGSPSRRSGGSFSRIMCGPIYAGDTFTCALLLGHYDTVDPAAIVRTFDASDMLLLESLNLFCGDIIRNFHLVDELRQLSVDMVRALISAIEQKDEYTSGHSSRVGLYAVLLAEESGLDATSLQMLEWSALLHDIGKIGIRDDVLKKLGKLTDEEFEHIKEHPRRSYGVVRQVPQLAAALDGVVYHHEHWDGSGYPEGLAGKEIPLQARIIQVADIFDALTSNRSYRKAFEWPKALSILREEAGKTADPELVVRFDAIIRRMAKEEPQRLQKIMSVHRVRGNGDQAWDTTMSALHPAKGGD